MRRLWLSVNGATIWLILAFVSVLITGCHPPGHL